MGKGLFYFGSLLWEGNLKPYSKRGINSCQPFGHRPIASPVRELVEDFVDVVLLRDGQHVVDRPVDDQSCRE